MSSLNIDIDSVWAVLLVDGEWYDVAPLAADTPNISSFDVASYDIVSSEGGAEQSLYQGGPGFRFRRCDDDIWMSGPLAAIAAVTERS